MFLPFTALDAARELAQSALPDAPIIEDWPLTAAPGRLRLNFAKKLHSLAHRLEGAQARRDSGPEFAH
ncbi:hypothetical protein FHU41_002585 [Psychromicrobium silvestre]|uniref:Uncharacterized protein n=1 Tax=Psychromicrobium silvestre TaxID=1645614 RepID=A0A7Y9S8D3_9MICC|nr:hypothetical protein [Psychromicrobium silvestre]NYE96335.1 hypothetical protein [Psychromicrobium silvestre]